MKERIVVVAPHPDDEVLGVGGTIARRASEGHEVTVVIVTRGRPPLFPEDLVQRGREEGRAAHALLGVKETVFLDLPAAELDLVPHREVNAKLAEVVRRITPHTMYVPFTGDIHWDHQAVFVSSLVAARPNHPDAPARVYAYETLSETNWNAPYISPGFHPNVFVDISAHLERKLQAVQAYHSQIRPFPNERSLEAVRALATLRGATVSRHAAEAFVLVRAIE